MSSEDWIRVAAIASFTLTAVFIDVRSHRLPNWLTVSAFFAGLAYHLAVGGAAGLLFSLGGFATGFGILLVLFLVGGGAAGDVKFMGAIGAWLGATSTLYVFFLSAVLAGAITAATALGMLFRNGLGRVRQIAEQRRTSLDGAAADGGRRSPIRRGMPYALPVALGTWLVLLWQVVGHKH